MVVKDRIQQSSAEIITPGRWHRESGKYAGVSTVRDRGANGTGGWLIDRLWSGLKNKERISPCIVYVLRSTHSSSSKRRVQPNPLLGAGAPLFPQHPWNRFGRRDMLQGRTPDR